ncbi:MAG: membrane protein insertion efficiency factor YidD [Verrucomicrobiota bacterium]|nr:membrane protein insertion efficiency factor YidD [Verrucomicrobiota bacterium]
MNYFLNQISLLIKLPMIALIRLYQMASPLKQLILGPYARCRFYPSCSEYYQACFKELPRHQAFLKSFLRISRCNPMHPGGYDPVSPKQNPDFEKLSKK